MRQRSNVTALFEDSKGALWIGTDGGGLLRRRDGPLTTPQPPMGCLTTLCFPWRRTPRARRFRLEHMADLDRLSQGKFHNLGVKDGLASNFVRAVKVDGQGTVWAGTTGGLGRIGPSSITNFTTANGLSGNEVFSLQIDAAGALSGWLQTRQPESPRERPDNDFCTMRTDY